MDTPDTAPTSLAASVPNPERVFPTLTPHQVSRIAAHGRRRSTKRGEVLVEVGDKAVPLFVVVSGEIQVLRPTEPAGTVIVSHHAGQFSGEGNMLTGRRSLARLVVSAPGEVLQLDREEVRSLIQTDAELSEILMRAFILRRVQLIARDLGDVVVIGSAHSGGTLRVQEFLTRNGHPFHYLDLDRDRDAQELLDRFQVTVADIPVVICRGSAVLRNPTNRQIADCLDFNEEIDDTRVTDLVIVGAGPAGLAAAVYGASEGLNVLVLESNMPGGQAGSSSRIENYLGFPTGISGLELTGRAYTQALKFGARVMVAKGATRLACDGQRYTVEIDGGPRIRTRAVIIASGAEYRKPALDNLAAFEGAGVYYGATAMEAQLCVGEEVVIVGGGNSAGQAAVFLASTVRRVHMLVRGPGLAETMSRYLIRRIEENSAIALRTHTQIVGLDGNGRLERIRWRDDRTGEVEAHDIGHVFMMTGAVPNTRWLDGCIRLDEKGFVKTGPDLSPDDLATAKWPLARPPYLLETSRPGIFAVGDVRGGNVKRVASAVGEGSIAVALVQPCCRRSARGILAHGQRIQHGCREYIHGETTDRRGARRRQPGGRRRDAAGAGGATWVIPDHVLTRSSTKRSKKHFRRATRRLTQSKPASPRANCRRPHPARSLTTVRGIGSSSP
jgi:thioredoxin reductase (NADPH)